MTDPASLRRLLEVADLLRARALGRLAEDQQALAAAQARKDARASQVEQAAGLFATGALPASALAALQEAQHCEASALARQILTLETRTAQARTSALRALSRHDILRRLAER